MNKRFSVISSKILALIILTLTLTAISTISEVRCEVDEVQAIRLLREVYSKLVEAEGSGADILNASLQLDKALKLIKQAEEDPRNSDRLISEAITLISNVDSMIPTLIEEGGRKTFFKNLYVFSAVSATLSSIILSYILSPRIFWSLWLRAKSRWLVKIMDEKDSVRRDDRRRG